LLPFLGITVLGVAFTEGAIAYHSFLQRRKEAAILSALGARKADLEWIYEAEPLGVNLLSALGALLISYPLSWFLSHLFAKKLGLSSLVSIPYLSAFGIPFLPIVTLFLFALCLTFFGVALPLHIANRKNLCEELREE
jgi:ABC-type antimicrobial peptide transport system permease subunit